MSLAVFKRRFSLSLPENGATRAVQEPQRLADGRSHTIRASVSQLSGKDIRSKLPRSFAISGELLSVSLREGALWSASACEVSLKHIPC